MCGIVGMISWSEVGLFQSEEATFVQMLYTDALRGMHGTGLFAVDKKGTIAWTKVGGPPHQLFETDDFEKTMNWIKKKDVKFLIGHNRHATKGQRITAHAHPFIHGEQGNKIILVHNGTLHDDPPLPNKMKFVVDSEAICYGIAHLGVEKILPTLKGAWTLVYYNEKDKTLNILRNKERPLFIARHEKWKFMAIASEKGTLRWLLDRNNCQDAVIHDVEVDQLMTFHLNNPEKPHVKPLKGYEWKAPAAAACEWFPPAEELAKDAVGNKQVSDAEKIMGTKSANEYPVREPSVPKNQQVIPFQKRQGYIKPPESKGNKPRDLSQDGSWVLADSLHDLGRGKPVLVQIFDWTPIPDSNDKWQLKAASDAYPDIEFYCNMTGKEEFVFKLLEAAMGIRGTIVSILKSQIHVGKFPHKVYINNPEPVDKLEAAN